MKRTLSLKCESLAALTTDELAGVAGAAATLPGCAALPSLDTTCVDVRESLLVCSGSGCHTWDSDCSCRV